MKQDLLVPNIGNFSIITVSDIFVKKGDLVKKNDTVISIETDKVNMDIPSLYTGIVKKIYFNIGDKIEINDTIMSLEFKDEILDLNKKNEKINKNFSNFKEIDENKIIYNKSLISENFLIYASPAVRRFANKLQVNLKNIVGTGRKNRITKIDVQLHFDKQYKNININENDKSLKENFFKFGLIKEKHLSHIKKSANLLLTKSWINIPHVTQFEEIDITEINKFRKNILNNIDYSDLEDKQKIGILSFIIKASVFALKENENFNASLSFDKEKLILKKYYNIGVVMDTHYGLKIPIIKNVNKKTILEISKNLAVLYDKSVNNKLSINEVEGGSFTISNLGNKGGFFFTPIINFPEVAILGFSKAIWKPVYKDKKIVIRLMLPLSLSYDHRVINGLDAIKFINSFIKNLTDIRCLFFS